MWGSVSFAQTGDAFYFGHISEPVFHYFYLKKLNQYFLLLPETLFTQASELQRVCGLKVLANAKFFSEFSEIVFVVKHNGGKKKAALNWLTSSSCSFCSTNNPKLKDIQFTEMKKQKQKKNSKSSFLTSWDQQVLSILAW